MEVRRRRAQDLAQVEAMAVAVRESDGYPPRAPDLFTGPDVLAAWVAEDERGDVVGHVALHRTGAAATVTLWSETTGWPAEQLGVVSRLFVAPTARRRGAGIRLLGQAVAEAHAIGRWPVLDVANHFHAAIALYERARWTRAGAVTFHFGDGPAVREAHSFVYVGPPPPGPVR